MKPRKLEGKKATEKYRLILKEISDIRIACSLLQQEQELARGFESEAEALEEQGSLDEKLDALTGASFLDLYQTAKRNYLEGRERLMKRIGHVRETLGEYRQQAPRELIAILDQDFEAIGTALETHCWAID